MLADRRRQTAQQQKAFGCTNAHVRYECLQVCLLFVYRFGGLALLCHECLHEWACAKNVGGILHRLSWESVVSQDYLLINGQLSMCISRAMFIQFRMND